MRHKRNLKRAGLAAIAALVIAAIAACGGSDAARTASTSSTAAVAISGPAPSAFRTGSVLTAEEWRRQATAICDPLPNPPSPSRLPCSLPAYAPGVSDYVKVLTRATNGLWGLRPPPQLAAEAANALALQARVVAAFQRFAAAAEFNDRSGAISPYEQGEGLIPQSKLAWHMLGVTC